MATWDTIGKVRMTPKGTHVLSNAYDILDIVTNANANIMYIAKQAVPANTALTDTDYWVKLIDLHDASIIFDTATQSVNGLMSAADKTKLDGIDTGAEKNSITGIKGNAESSYRSGTVNLTAANIGAKATQSAVNDPTANGTSITFISNINQTSQGVISPTKKTVRNASQSASGLMSADDKKKLDDIETGAQVNPGVATASYNGLMSSSDKAKLNGIETGAQKNPTATATQSANGLMSSSDKTKLDGIESGAQVNPNVATQSISGLMSYADKIKLDGIAVGAQVNNINIFSLDTGDNASAIFNKLNNVLPYGGTVAIGYINAEATNILSDVNQTIFCIVRRGNNNVFTFWGIRYDGRYIYVFRPTVTSSGITKSTAYIYTGTSS